jgi:hypothetical protein
VVDRCFSAVGCKGPLAEVGDTVVEEHIRLCTTGEVAGQEVHAASALEVARDCTLEAHSEEVAAVGPAGRAVEAEEELASVSTWQAEAVA